MKKIDFVDGKFTTEEIVETESNSEDTQEDTQVQEQVVIDSPKIKLPSSMNIIQSKDDNIFIRLDVNGWAKISQEEALAIVNTLSEILIDINTVTVND